VEKIKTLKNVKKRDLNKKLINVYYIYGSERLGTESCNVPTDSSCSRFPTEETCVLGISILLLNSKSPPPKWGIISPKFCTFGQQFFDDNINYRQCKI